MPQLTRLFEPITIGGMELKNRVVMAPLGHGLTLAKKDGTVTDEFIAFYEARAKGGVGLIELTVAALGRPHATGMVFAPGMLSVIDDEHIPSARRFVDAIHSHGTKVTFQITHHGSAIARAVQARPPVDYPELMRVVTATGTRDPVTGFETHSMTKEEIESLKEAFAAAARRGKAAGFDGVRIQACHGYLIRQFLSPRTNKRTDEYGGSPEKRARLGCELISVVREEVGPDFPIVVRMNGNEHFEGGITIEEGIQHSKLFLEAGADILDISSGPGETSQWQFVTMFQPSGLLVPDAAAIKKATGGTVMVVGKINAILGERILEEGSADLIQIGRGLMADAELANKAKEGRFDEIQPCIYCGHCQSGGTGGAIANCTVNPGMGRELEYGIEPATQKKKVMVIGGGPAGMEAARILSERGHEVSLYEKSDKLGGQWKAVTAQLPEQGSLINYLSTGLDRAGVKVLLNQAVNTQLVQDQKPDAVVVATGSKPTTLDIPGVDGKNVVQAVDVLMGKAEVGQGVVVIGGRIVGLTAALFLAEKGKKVSIVTRGQIARQLYFRNIKPAVGDLLIKKGVYLYPYSKPDSITENGVNIWWDSSSDGQPGAFAFIKADTIVLAVGSENDNQLVEQLAGLAPEVYPIGDCAGKRSVFAAMRGGSEIAKKI